jgi:hypothetical protein
LIYFYHQIHIIISLLLGIIAILAIFVLFGRFVASIFLEGYLVRRLIANNGELDHRLLKKRQGRYQISKMIISRLENREVIEVTAQAVRLKGQNYKNGFKNWFMMWGTRNIKF